MIHPCTIKDPSGKIKMIFSTSYLTERSKAVAVLGDGFFKSHKVREGRCDREGCDNPFWTKQRGKRYCSTDCSIIIQRAIARRTKERKREKKREAANA